VAVSGAAAAVAVLLASAGPGILALRPDPTTAPPLPALAALGVLVALLPAWLAPVPAPDGEAEESPGAGVPAHGSRATAA
jgi:energy-coupling factor transport system permease protein